MGIDLPPEKDCALHASCGWNYTRQPRKAAASLHTWPPDCPAVHVTYTASACTIDTTASLRRVNVDRMQSPIQIVLQSRQSSMATILSSSNQSTNHSLHNMQPCFGIQITCSLLQASDEMLDYQPHRGSMGSLWFMQTRPKGFSWEFTH